MALPNNKANGSSDDDGNNIILNIINNNSNNNNNNRNINNNNNNYGSSGNSSCSDDDSDMFGPPRSSPNGYHHHRSRVPMISPKLRQREERKRIMQLCAHKLERIKDSESDLRRTVCINNTYCRLIEEARREKQLRDILNRPKIENDLESERENIFQPNSADATLMNNSDNNNNNNHNNNINKNAGGATYGNENNNNNNNNVQSATAIRTICSIENHQSPPQQQIRAFGGNDDSTSSTAAAATTTTTSTTSSSGGNPSPTSGSGKRPLSSRNLVNDLEILDRELSAINAPMPLIDPEITQGAEQLERAALLSASRKRRSSTSNNNNNNSGEDEIDRLVREAFSPFYMPSSQRLISAIDDSPLIDVVGLGVGGGGGAGVTATTAATVTTATVNTSDHQQNHNHNQNQNHHFASPPKRAKLNGGEHLELVDFDMSQSQKDFEVIMDALRLGTPSPPTGANDSCGQAAMMSESSASVFHNLVVTSLET